MAIAYNPGLKVTDYTIFTKERRLPMAGEVLVKVGDRVTSDQVVARTYLPGNVHPLNAANVLNVLPKDLGSCMHKKEGDAIELDEVIAGSSSFFGLFKSQIHSPIAGTIETISEVTGQLMLREKPIPVEVNAFIDGEVIEVLPGEGAVIQTPAAFIQGIFGIGGEVMAPLQTVVASYDKALGRADILPEHRGKIIVGGSLITSAAIEKAIEVGVCGIISGGINDKDLKEFLGYDLGVAITGSEDKGITLIITEGFGTIAMAAKTFELLQKNQGEKACINGATQIRAGVIRPEIVIPKSEKQEIADNAATSHGLEQGCPVRLIREPHFGSLATVVSLPVELHKMESEAMVRVVEVELPGGEKQVVPRANVEIIEDR